ncbi:MAG: ImmA/IrrE family metallo-endopeptidase [Euryarchaeota archaeon]|nr:ImmA/IrrE family metallo-endopeptidase [Euryarchaeota archaeon]
MEAADKITVDEATVSAWEKGEIKPTIVQLKQMAHVYRRPLTVFFLRKPPLEPKMPRDFRLASSGIQKELSPQTRLAIRRAQRMQALAMEMTISLGGKKFPALEHVKLSDEPEMAAVTIRSKLNIDLNTQLNDWMDDKSAFEGWKNAIEKIGFYVFQIGMPEEEISGFSLIDDRYPVVVINKRDYVQTRKTFTLMHEFAHHLLHESGICKVDDKYAQSGHERAVEVFCNAFAGAILAPSDALRGHPVVKTYAQKCYDDAWVDRDLSRIARDFKVSKEVILRRLTGLKLASVKFYRSKRDDWAKKSPGKPMGGQRSVPKECLQENGIPYTSLVLENYRTEKITYADVADYLDVRTKYIPKVEELSRESA